MNEKKTKTIDCPRCSGLGTRKVFSHVLGGICFKCNGARKVVVSINHKPSKMFKVMAAFVTDYNDHKTGEMGIVYNMRAKSPAEALRSAQNVFETVTSTQFKNAWADPSTWIAVEN